MIVVADTSPLIALTRVGHLSLLEALFGEVLVPPAVVHEAGFSLPDFIRVHELSRPTPDAILRASLDPGETEAISLALEIGADRLILDERLARHVARGLGLPIVGVLDILLASKEKHLIPAVRPILDALLTNRFRLTPDLYEWLLAEAEETGPQR